MVIVASLLLVGYYLLFVEGEGRREGWRDDEEKCASVLWWQTRTNKRVILSPFFPSRSPSLLKNQNKNPLAAPT